MFRTIFLVDKSESVEICSENIFPNIVLASKVERNKINIFNDVIKCWLCQIYFESDFQGRKQWATWLLGLFWYLYRWRQESDYDSFNSEWLILKYYYSSLVEKKKALFLQYGKLFLFQQRRLSISTCRPVKIKKLVQSRLV